MRSGVVKSILYGCIASAILLAVYFGILTLVSGWSFAQSQFAQFWYFIVSLALGFGLQIGLFVYLKQAIHDRNASGKIVAVSGTTSTIAMVSCCAHYLVNIIPIIGVTGFVSVIAQYQIELFWVGLISNIFGIIYIARKIYQYKHSIP